MHSHSSRRISHLLSIVLAAACFWMTPVAEADTPVPIANPTNNTASSCPLPPEEEHELRVKPETGMVYQSDLEPINDRQALLLIHGGGSEHVKLFHWAKVIEAFVQNEQFRRKYKIFLLRYDSAKSLEDAVADCKGPILALYRSIGSKPLTVMALSLGGNVIQLGLEDPEIDQAVVRVIALATPFHGSPLFSADWFQYSLYKSRYFPVLRVLDSVDYRVYFSRHKTYQQDLRWDDADDLLPQVGHFASKLPFGPKGYLTLSRDSNNILSEIDTHHKINKKKLVTYAGYLVNPYVLNSTHSRWRYPLLNAFRFISTQIRAQMGREQAALMVLNREISKVDAGPNAAVLGSGAHVYALNDGITPVSSALFLPDTACREHPLLHESDILSMRPFVDVQKARVFRNFDHVTFVEGKPVHQHSKLARDEMHPEDGSREIFDWMLNEVLGVDTSSAQAATKSTPN